MQLAALAQKAVANQVQSQRAGSRARGRVFVDPVMRRKIARRAPFTIEMMSEEVRLMLGLM